MTNTDALFREILADPAHIAQIKISIAGKDYIDDAVVSAVTSGTMFSGNKVAIGCAVGREIDIVIKPDGNAIPRSAEINVYLRLVLPGISGEIKSASAWIPKGVFFIDTREPDVDGESLMIHGYDAMLKGEQPFLDQEAGETDVWPQSMRDVALACAAKMGVEIEQPSELSSTYTIGYPTDYTCRELLEHIAAAHGGNWIISDDGKLRLVRLGQLDADNEIQIGRMVSDFSALSPLDPISRLTLLLDDEHCVTAGDDTGRALEADCPWATQEICDDALSVVRGYQYVPYSASDAILNPAAEIGDCVIIDGVRSVIASMASTFDPLYTADLSAPADEELDHEFPYTPKINKTINRKIAQAKSEITVKLDSITLKVVGEDGSVSEVKLTDKGQIDLTGYATFRGLSDGTTVIDGGCIRADSKIVSPIIIGSKIYAENPDSGTSKDYAAMEADGFAIRTPSGDALLKLGTSGFPFLQLGWGTGEYGTKGLLKKFFNGLWIGNSVVENDTGNFVPREGCNGIFVDIDTSMVYVVHDTSMQNVYTGDAVARFG